MTIWIFAILVLALGGAIGFALGAIRALVCFVGLFLGALLAVPIGMLLGPLIGLIGLANPVWAMVLPPLVFLLIVGLVFLGISFFVHRPIETHYRYKADDFHRRAWERMNQRLGIVPGLLSALILLLVTGVFIYVAGYVTVAFAQEEGEPFSVRMLNTMRKDMVSSGFDRVIAPLDPAPAKFYEVVDLGGFIYWNLPKIRERMANYPVFYSMLNNADVQAFLEDKEYQEMLNRKASFTELFQNPKTAAMVVGLPALPEIQNLDLKDLRAYLESGKSSKFDPLQILGTWELDVEQVIVQTKKAKPDITSSQMAALKKVLLTVASGINIKAYYDNRLAFSIQPVIGDWEQMKKAAAALSAPPPPPPTAVQEEPGMRGIRPEDRMRYGMGGRRARQDEPQEAPAEAAAPVKLDPVVIQGTWEGEDDRYTIKLQDPKGNAQEMVTRIVADEMVISYGRQKLVFVKQ
ncbi:MAG TPA: CvpA family protein [Candidatus Paceibacterota bacterium]|nr:CvpA family protein [Verrucomicrobiota bacterium]HRY48900.1 CvpA family protein [Candidatus Paceibacterota bacterium]HRZ99955.1 CvpA family protein [Candidatus Paceibacterota bacterium]